jgi:Fe-S cluster assembly protein SufD
MKKKFEKFAANFLGYFNEIENELDNLNGALYGKQRTEAYEKYKSGTIQLPHNKMEDYLYSNLKKNFSNNFVYYSSPQRYNVYPKDLFVCDVPELNAHTAILINGWYHDYNGEKLTVTPDGVVFGSLIYAYNNGYKDIITNHLNKELNADEPLVALNNMFAQDGFFVYIPDNVKASTPIQLINLVSALEEVILFPIKK